jgi:hypothetical protein
MSTQKQFPNEINPQLKPFAVLIGEWEIVSPQFPGAKGRETFEWLEDGAYLLNRSYAPEPAPSGTLIIGSDESSKGIYVLHHDSRNVSRLYEMSLDKDTWKIWRNAPGFFQRFEGKISQDGKTITAKWEKSYNEGSNWEHDFDLLYKRVSEKR